MSKKECPNSWSEKSLEDVSDRVFSGGTPSRSNEDYWDGEYHWLSSSELGNGKITEANETITERGLNESSASLFPPNSVLIAMYGKTRGKSGMNEVEMTGNQAICCLDAQDTICPEYIWYQIQENRPQLIAMGGGAGQQNIRQSIIRKLRIPVPTRNEQEQIASVLFAVDKHIEMLDQRYDYLCDLKHGLMQDLFLGRRRLVQGKKTDTSSNISGNGSELTQSDIPSDWTLETIGDICEINASVSESSNNVDYLPMDALSEELPWPEYTKKRDPSEHSGTLFKENDTLVAKITPCTENGKSAFIDELDSEFGIATTEVITLTPTEIHPKYLYYYTTSHPAKNYAVSRMRGTSGRQRVPKSVFERELQIPVPSEDEQERIASMLYLIDNMLKVTDHLVDEYGRLKKGLMQDLLSGDVRVPENLDVMKEITK